MGGSIIPQNIDFVAKNAMNAQSRRQVLRRRLE
jgi:hypothetical protein